jgi:hypothetical protein
MKWQWMMFKPEGNDVVYLWTGTHVQIVHVAPHEGKEKDWYWSVSNTGVYVDLNEHEVKLLTEVLASRKQVFKIPRQDRRYTVIHRGTYPYQNI